MKNKEKLVTIIMTVIMCTAMGLLFAFLARKSANEQALMTMPPAPVMYITSILESNIVGIILALIIPMGKLGKALAARFNAVPPSMKFTTLNSLPFAVISAFLVSAICCFISIAQSHAKIPAEAAPPLMAMWFGSWIRTLPLSIILGYVLALLISPIVVKAVGLGGPPAGTGGPDGAGRPDGTDIKKENNI